MAADEIRPQVERADSIPVAGHASIQLNLDRYSHLMPSVGRSTANGMDEALDYLL